MHFRIPIKCIFHNKWGFMHSPPLLTSQVFAQFLTNKNIKCEKKYQMYTFTKIVLVIEV